MKLVPPGLWSDASACAMTDPSPRIARLKVLGVTFRLLKSQKVSWSIFEPADTQPTLTTSSEEQAKKTTQTWTSTNYTLYVRED